MMDDWAAYLDHLRQGGTGLPSNESKRKRSVRTQGKPATGVDRESTDLER